MLFHAAGPLLYLRSGHKPPLRPSISFQGHSFLRRIFSPDRSRNRYGACRDDTPRKNPDKAAHASPALSRTAPFRSFPVRLRRTGAHGNGTASASFRCRRPKIAHGLPPGGRAAFFFPSKRSDTVPQVRNARRRQPFPSREGHRPAKRTLRRSGRPGVFLTGTTAKKCRYGRHETAIAVSRHGFPGNKPNANGRILLNAAVFLCVGPSGSDEAPGPIRAMRRFSPPARFRDIRRPDGRRPARL